MRIWKYITVWIVIFALLLPLGAVVPGVDKPMYDSANPGGLMEHSESAEDSDMWSEPDGGAASRGSRVITASDLIWPMFGRDEQHTFIATPTTRGIFTPDEKWVSGQLLDSLGAAIGNFKPNIFGTYTRDVNFVVYADAGTVYIVDGGTGESAWEMDADLIDSVEDNDLIFTSPAIADLNKNGKMDIVIALDDLSNNSYVYAFEPVIKFNSTGYNWANDAHGTEKLWEYYTGVDMSYSSPVLADLDRNGNLDVVIGGSDTSAWLFAINGNDGKALSGNWPYELNGARTSTPAIYDFGSNSRVVITSIELDSYYVYVISDSAQTLHQKTIDMNLPIGLVYNVVPSPAIGQMNRSSSSNEIVVAVPIVTSTGRVYCLANDLTELWSTPYTAGQFESSPAIVDIDNDVNNDMDVVVASWDSFGTHLYAIEGRTGDMLWDQYKNLGVGVSGIIASPALVDVNTDTVTDTIFVAHDELFALNGTDGTYLWNFTLASGTGTRQVRSSPAVGEIDKDKFLDIFVDGSLISHYIIDLTLTKDDIEFSHTELVQGQEISITAVIHNTGQAEAENVIVTFLEDGVLIDNATIEVIPGGDTRGATVIWTPVDPGELTLKISVDQDNNIEEIAENNNEISMKLNIIPAFPDLTFDELRFYRGDGKQVDNINTHLIESEESRVTAVTHNIGGLKAENILVRFREGSVNLGVDRLIGRLGVNESEEVGLNWTPPLGYHSIEAQVDPINGIDEANETNNNIVEPSLFVKSSDPGDAGYQLTGKIFKPDGSTPAAFVSYSITNDRTGNFLSGTASISGNFNRDLNELSGGYMEGEKISIYATDGSNESLVLLRAYSEDDGIHHDIVLSSLPRYTVGLTVDDDARDIDPGSSVQFEITVENKGNTNNTIDLNHSNVIDVNSGEPALNWSVNLDAYSVNDVDAGAKVLRRLSVRAPGKSSEALAGQVVRVSVNAVSTDDRTQTDTIMVYATLTRKYSVQLDVQPAYLEYNPANATPVRFNIKLSNLGNGPDLVSILVSNVTLDILSIDVASPVELDTGQAKTVPLSLSLKDDHPPGLFSLSVHLRSEDGTLSQPRHLTVKVTRPDLTVTIQMPGKITSSGTGYDVTVRVYNNGTAPVSNVEVELKLNNEASSTVSEIIDSIGADRFETEVLSFALDPLVVDYTLKVTVDPDDRIVESIEDNNQADVSLRLGPDLAFDGDIDIEATVPIREGSDVTLKAMIINQGDLPAPGGFTVKFYFTKSGSRIAAGELEVQEELVFNENYEVSVEWEAVRGVSEIFCWVDSERDIDEISEENNEISTPISISSLPPQGPQGSGSNNLALAAGGILVFIIIIIVMIMVFRPPAEEDEDEDEEDEEKEKDSGRVKVEGKQERKKSGSGKSYPDAGDEDEDEDEPEEMDIVSSLVRGVKSLNPLAPPKKKVKRKHPAKAREVLELKTSSETKREMVIQARRTETITKIKKADDLIKSRSLEDREKILDRRSQILKKKERDLKSVKDDLVEIGILEADVIDDLEKEEVEMADDDDAVEVEPIE